jgi:hypothetical protein
LKLIKAGIDPFLLEALKKMQSDSLFNDFYLVGGTALSLQIGHRVSEDIDLFTKNKFDKEAIFDYAKKNLSSDYKIINNSNIIFQLLSEKKKLKLDFVNFQYDLLDPLIEEEGIRMIDKNDISAMKISAAGTRGSEAKDYVDIYCLLKYVPFEKMVENFRIKFQSNDVLHYLRSVMYFDDVEEETWKSINFLNKKISPNEIKNRLTKEVVAYERNILKNTKK